MDLISFLTIIGAVIAFLLLIGLILGRLYRRATREVSLVKTGAGGKRVIMDGGAIVIPLLHEISPVNMKTLRLEVKRASEGALITKDRMRVDVGAVFYVSVQATEDGISRAAQTLGDRIFNVDQLREMIEGKLIDGLRAVAARMSMDELHENRTSFVQEVQNAVSNDLLKNGLELESVSLTALDENNAFNAVGMRKLAEVIATSKKERAQIDAEADVAVRRAAMEAEKQKMQIARDEEESRIARAQEIEVANQERQIIINEKSEAESRARASADTARAEAIKAQEAIETARATAQAEREKDIAVIEARREAERSATSLRLAAEAERAAAADRAAARREEARPRRMPS